jgi:hypothetical protein
MKRILALAILLAATSSVLYAQTQSRKHPVEKFFMTGIAAFNDHNLDGFIMIRYILLQFSCPVVSYISS